MKKNFVPRLGRQIINARTPVKTPAQERRNTRLSLIAVPAQRLDPALNGAQSQKAEKISIMSLTCLSQLLLLTFHINFIL